LEAGLSYYQGEALGKEKRKTREKLVVVPRPVCTLAASTPGKETGVTPVSILISLWLYATGRRESAIFVGL
jgi:hypothetical protein